MGQIQSYVNELGSGDDVNGYYADLRFDFVGLVQIGAVFEGYVVTFSLISPSTH